MMFAPATMPWFALHEWRLMWRDGVAMMTGGYPARRIGLIAFIIVVAIALHLMANAIMGPWIANGIVPDKPTLVLITGSGFLFWTVMLSQALESVTRAYYARSDLDLILSSPASSRTLFAVRTGITALTTLLLACLLASPVVDVLVIRDGVHWLMAYAVLAALSALATAIAVLITVTLFRIAGTKRTRLIAQIIAAIIGAGFVIGIQAVAILHFGNMSSRFALFGDPQFVASMPDLTSLVWAPAKAALGDWPSLLGILALARGRISENLAATIGVGSMAIAAGVTALLDFRFLTHPPEGGAYTQVLWTWMKVGDFAPQFALRLDGLSMTMMSVITGVGFMIHLFASWYMRGDEANVRPELPGYAVTDIRLIGHLPHATLRAYVTNIFNRRYSSFGVYARNVKGPLYGPPPSDPGDAPVERFLTPGQPRLLVLSIGVAQ